MPGNAASSSATAATSTAATTEASKIKGAVFGLAAVAATSAIGMAAYKYYKKSNTSSSSSKDDNEEVVEVEVAEEAIYSEELNKSTDRNNVSSRSWDDIVEEDLAELTSQASLLETEERSKAEMASTAIPEEAVASGNSIKEQQQPLITSQTDSGVASPIAVAKPAAAAAAAVAAEVEDLRPKVRSNSAEDGGLGGSLCGEDASAVDRQSAASAMSDSGQGSEADEGGGGTGGQGGGVATADVHTRYQFFIPNELVGMFIGAQGRAITRLKTQSRCNVELKRILLPTPKNNGKNGKKATSTGRYYMDDPHEPQICLVEGPRSKVEKCLDEIRYRFSLDEFPELTLEEVHVPSDISLLTTASPQHALLAGHVEHVTVSAIVTAGQIFIQLPSHPSYFALSRLESCMQNVYGPDPADMSTSPPIPRPSLQPGLVAVVPSMEPTYEDGSYSWYRCQVVNFDNSNDTCDVKLLDYGGYYTYPSSQLRQIRQDFTALPFQAIEVLLSNIVPTDAELGWSMESIMALNDILRNKSLSGHLVGFSADMMPVFNLYAADYADLAEISTAPPPMLVNRKLVDDGFAAWVEQVDTIQPHIFPTNDITIPASVTNASPAAVTKV